MAAKLVRWGMKDWRDGGTLHCVKVIFSWDMKCTKTTNQVACDLKEVTQPNDVINQYLKKKNRLSRVMLPSKTFCFRGNHYLNDTHRHIHTHRHTHRTFFYSNFYLILYIVFSVIIFFYIFISIITFTVISLFRSGDVSTAARTDKAFGCHCHGNMLPAHTHGNIFCKRTNVYLSFPTHKQPYL